MTTPFYIQNLDLSPFQFLRQGTDLTVIDSPSLDSNGEIVYTTYKAYVSLPNTTSLFVAFDPTNPGNVLPLTEFPNLPTYNLYYVVKPYYGYQFPQLNNNLPTDILPGNFIVNSGDSGTGGAYTLIAQDVFFYSQLYMDYSTVLPYTLAPSQLGVSINNTPPSVTQEGNYIVYLPQFTSYTQPVNNNLGLPLNIYIPIEESTNEFNYSTNTSPILEYSSSSAYQNDQLILTTQIQNSKLVKFPFIVVDAGGGNLIEKTNTGALYSGTIDYGDNLGEAIINLVLNTGYTFLSAVPMNMQYSYLYESINVEKRTQFPYYIKNNMETFPLTVTSLDSYIDYKNTSSITLQPGQMYVFNVILNNINLTQSFWDSNLLT